MDPTTAASVVKVAGTAADDALKTGSGLIARVLGPSADELGEYFRRQTKRRLDNTKRIAEAAERKGATDRPGEVNARLAHKVLEEGSFVDGELAAEYFGGMLAGSKTSDGRNDVAVSWASMLANMSSLQIRLHFLLYREWARLLSGRSDLPLGMDDGRLNARMVVALHELLVALTPEQDADYLGNMEHAIIGLHRLGLLGNYGWGPRAGFHLLNDSPYEMAAAFVPSAAGFELYGWALGISGLTSNQFSARAIPFDTEPPTLSLSTAVLPALPAAPSA